jgi:predicted small secreted protein
VRNIDAELRIDPAVLPARMMHLESYMVRKVVAFALVAGTLLVSACNTVSGAGKDVSSAGKAVTNTAEKSK